MIRRPPRSTLFPTRRSSDLYQAELNVVQGETALDVTIARRGERFTVRGAQAAQATDVLQKFYDDRSEEHTSELQSRQYLVCRLLLEKKKKHVVIRTPIVDAH